MVTYQPQEDVSQGITTTAQMSCVRDFTHMDVEATTTTTTPSRNACKYALSVSFLGFDNERFFPLKHQSAFPGNSTSLVFHSKYMKYY